MTVAASVASSAPAASASSDVCAARSLFRLAVAIPTMAVGNISSYMDVNTIIAAGRADLCLLARAHLFDPYWARHAAWMQNWPLPWPDPYRSVERYAPRFEFRFTGDK